jgi:predicted secreted protein
MKQWWLAAALAACLGLSGQAFAFGHTTVVSESISGGTIPYVDGMKEAYLQKNVNSLLKERGEALQRQAGKNARLSYEITVNRPSMFSVIFKAEGEKTIYSGITIDVAAGSELEEKDLLYTNTVPYQQMLQGKHFVYGENGFLVQRTENGPFDQVIPYQSVVKSINVAGGARLLTSYKLTRESADKTLELKAGELVALYLDANPTTGLDWTLVDKSKAAGFADLGHSFYLPMVNQTGTGGSPGQTILFFSFDKPGTYDVMAVYRRKMEKSPYDELTYHFIVK